MAINKIMATALKALSYPDVDIKKNYKVDRLFQRILNPGIKPFYKIFDFHIEVGSYAVPSRLFIPKMQKSDELFLFFHGGGWVKGDINTYTRPCAALADHTGRRVLSVDYRLAPEYPFPTAVNDCYSAAKALFEHPELLGIKREQIILIGDSAGGNLAAAVSLMAADKKEFKVSRQVLLYPATYNDHSASSPYKSVIENGSDYLLTTKRINDYFSLYLNNEEDRNNPYFAPLLAKNLTGQPKTLIITAEYDLLRDEGEAYGEKLKSFGCEVEIYRVDDALHGFFSLPVKFSASIKSFELINKFLDKDAEVYVNAKQME